MEIWRGLDFSPGREMEIWISIYTSGNLARPGFLAPSAGRYMEIRISIYDPVWPATTPLRPATTPLRRKCCKTIVAIYLSFANPKQQLWSPTRALVQTHRLGPRLGLGPRLRLGPRLIEVWIFLSKWGETVLAEIYIAKILQQKQMFLVILLRRRTPS